MKNYINISPQEVEEMAEKWVYDNGFFAPCSEAFSDGHKRAELTINTQLTPILHEAVRVMEGQLKYIKDANAFKTEKLKSMISDLEKSINNIKALKQ